MAHTRLLLVQLFILVLIVPGALAQHTPTKPMTLADKIKRFTPTEIKADLSRLSPGDRKALAKLVDAAKYMDSLYARQVWGGNPALRTRLEADKSPAGKEIFHYYNINSGPWAVMDNNTSFVPGVPAERPPHANYYPDDMTKEEFTSWLATLPEAEQTRATGFFTTIRRDGNGALTIIPYNEEYKDLLVPAAQLLRDAAALTDNTSLKTFLTKRADAFLSNDYYDSDVAWMDLDSPIEPTIGPYEVYMDELFNYKAAFEAYITLRNDEETNKVNMFSGKLQEIENNLPIEERYKNPKLGALAPIRVVDEVAIGGEARSGIQTAAFNLPNDEKVTTEKGSKRVMLKNVQEAKFKSILTPVSRIAIDKEQLKLVAFEPFFTHILAHELLHGIGPHSITIDGKPTTVRQAMKELSSALEEAKADISGLFGLQYLIDKGVVEKPFEKKMYVTFLAGGFRSIRFGLTDAHGRGMALQFNYLMDEGAFVHNDKTGTFKIDFEKIKPAVRKLTGEIMTIQAEGSYEKAKALLDRYVLIRPVMQKTIDKMIHLPVDIEPRFVLKP